MGTADILSVTGGKRRTRCPRFRLKGYRNVSEISISNLNRNTRIIQTPIRAGNLSYALCAALDLQLCLGGHERSYCGSGSYNSGSDARRSLAFLHSPDRSGNPFRNPVQRKAYNQLRFELMEAPCD